MKVVEFPNKGIPHELDGKAIYAQPEPTDEQVWSVCPYLRDKDRCMGCPKEELHDGEPVRRMCRMLAEEVCRIVMATAPKD